LSPALIASETILASPLFLKTTRQSLRSSFCACLLSLAALLLTAPLAQAETLASTSYHLGSGGFHLDSDAVLRNASEMLPIQSAVLGQVEACRSTGPSGLSLQGGLVPVPVPEPNTGLLLFSGASALVGLPRHRGCYTA
jgi:hypothetical protein